MDFVQPRGLISLLNDNHVDNNLKEMFVYTVAWLIDPKTGG